MRDHWNNVEVTDEAKLTADVIAVIKKAGELSYSEMQELRIAAELCDRGHFKRAAEVIAAKAGEPLPKELDYILEDPDFDVRVSFMKAVVEAVDPAPAGTRVKK
jgi:hypothetical protein